MVDTSNNSSERAFLCFMFCKCIGYFFQRIDIIVDLRAARSWNWNQSEFCGRLFRIGCLPLRMPIKVIVTHIFPCSVYYVDKVGAVVIGVQKWAVNVSRKCNFLICGMLSLCHSAIPVDLNRFVSRSFMLFVQTKLTLFWIDWWFQQLNSSAREFPMQHDIIQIIKIIKSLISLIHLDMIPYNLFFSIEIE